MPTIFIKDALRASVEAASGGRQTVLYTALGQPTYMNVIPQFKLEDVDAEIGIGVHPAFIVNGVAKSEIFIGTYQGAVKNGELLSLPGVDPKGGNSHDTMVDYARACGAGFHCMSNAEFAALALWCRKNGFSPRGNNNYGRDHAQTHETGRRQDGLLVGDTSGYGRALTGSGPVSWRHDNTPNGIADLCGNIWEICPGLRIVPAGAGLAEIQIIANNDAALNATDLSATSASWKAIHGSTGALITPTFTGSLAVGDYLATTANSVKIGATSSAAYTLGNPTATTFDSMVNNHATPVAAPALQALKALGIFPVTGVGTLSGDGFLIDLTAERIALRGGGYSNTLTTGIFAINLMQQRMAISQNIGARPAFVL